MSLVDPTIQHLVDRKGQLWLERTLVVKPDAGGYGFSLSGEQPVFVDHVVEGGPSHQAGIQRGDRIIRLDGAVVFDKKHTEVVDILKGASCVSLTVITKISGQSKHIPGTQEVDPQSSAPKRIQELNLQVLKTMLQKQQRSYEQLALDYTKMASSNLEEELRDCEDIIKTLQGEIAVKTNQTIEAVAQSTEASMATLIGPEQAAARNGRLARDDNVLAQKILQIMTPEDLEVSGSTQGSPDYLQSPAPSASSTMSRSLSPSKLFRGKSPKLFRKMSLSKNALHSVSMDAVPMDRSATSSPTKHIRPLPHSSSSNIVMNDSDSEDDLHTEISVFGPFTSLQELNNYPAHLSVFLHYLVSNEDPKYLCFYLVARSYQNIYRGSEVRQRALEIAWTFCLPSSPLFVDLEVPVQLRIMECLQSEDTTDMKVRSVFVEARDVVASQLAKGLERFRLRRSMGLGGFFGEHKLSENMSRSQEMEVASSILVKDIRDILTERPEDSEDNNRRHAIADSICTFLLEITNGKSKAMDSTMLENVHSFTRGEHQSKKKLSKAKKQSRVGHAFILTFHRAVCVCDVCGRVLWGVGYQGYQCTVCGINVHRHGCWEEVEPCQGKRKKSTPRKQTADPNHLSQVQSDEEGDFRPRGRSVSEPEKANTLIRIHDDAETVARDIHKKKPRVSVKKSQSLKENRPDQQTNKLASQDTSLTTTPSVNSVASSSGSMSDESLNTSGSSGQPGAVSSGGMSKSSTLDTVIEASVQPRTPSMDDDALQELQDADVEKELTPWSLSVGVEVRAKMHLFEIKRQELLRELVHTERTHLKKLLIMKHIYKNPLHRLAILSGPQVDQLFPSLEELVQMHSGLCSDMKERASESENGVIHRMADTLLQRFNGAAGERLCHACSVFASNQSRTERTFKEMSLKNPKFKQFVKDAETNPYCMRLSLKDILPTVWQRPTKYRLLIEQICNLNRKNSDKLSATDKVEAKNMETTLSAVKNILNYVNKQVKQTENKQKLQDYQLKLDTTPLERTSHPITEKYKDLTLSSDSRKLLYEGTLMWKLAHRRTVEVHALLLTDILVLLSKPEDGSDRLVLRRHHIDNIGGQREEISSVIRISDMLLRHLAADTVGRTFLVVNNSSLMKFAQMYELTAETSREKKRWEEAIEKAMTASTGAESNSPELCLSPGLDDRQFSLPILMSNVPLRDRLIKIDDDVQRLLDEKLAILRTLQGADTVPLASPTIPMQQDDESLTVKGTTESILALSDAIMAQVSKLMVPNLARQIVSDAQYQLTELTANLQKQLSHVVILTGNASEGLATENSLTESLERETNASSSLTDQPIAAGFHIDELVTPTETPDDSSHSIAAALSSRATLPVDLEREVQKDLAGLDGKENCEDVPPLPTEPPPSSSSESSRTNSQDLLSSPEREFSLPQIGSETSVEDWHTESSTAIIAPPESFLGCSPPKCLLTKVRRLVEEEQEESDDDEQEIGEAMHSSTPKLYQQPHDNQATMDSPKPGDGFRRARSNPSISSNRIVMSVIASPTASSAGEQLNRASSEDFTFPKAASQSPPKRSSLIVSKTETDT